MQTLREMILSGELAGGAQLRESELCEQLQVSRHSLRTAFRALAATGMIRHEANHGVFVAQLQAADIHDIYSLRRPLEVEAILELAKYPDRRPPVLVALERLEQAHPALHWAEVRDLDLQFHLALVASMGRPRATRTFVSLIDELALAFRQLKDEFEGSADVGRQHRAIYEAAVKGTPREAERLVISHLAEGEESICRALGEAGGN
jgi:DNA-binding GntR family transcriptional regulator